MLKQIEIIRAKARLLIRFSGWQDSARWILLSVAVGVVAGLGAVFFDHLLDVALHSFVHRPMSYLQLGPDGLPIDSQTATRFSFWIIPIATLGGLASGLLVFLVAPEAEGHGTDAMIESFHLRGGYVRKRAPIVKIIASALTIGTGGSAGKEGPIAQIGSGFGSLLAGALGLKPQERRLLLLAGAAGGIGAIFQAPLGAALFVPGVLYGDTEYESDAILPCIISSIIAHTVFTQIFGQAAIFQPGHVNFDMPRELLPYTIFGVVCAVVGFLYVKVFYGIRDHFFAPMPIPRVYKPAVGGFLLGVVAVYFPQIIDGGYLWIQAALTGNLAWKAMLVLVFMKIIATSFTIASGGSGGVFGPSVFIGAMLGGAFGMFGHELSPEWVVNPQSYVLVGMGGFFAGVARVPVSSVIMACEMSASYELLVPLMLVSSLSYILLGKTTLYEKQLANRLASPAHTNAFARSLLATKKVRDAVSMYQVSVLEESLPFGALVKIMTSSPETYFPIVDKDGRMTGILSINDIREIMFENTLADLIVAKDVATQDVVRVHLDENLQQTLDKMAAIDVNELPVVSRDKPDEPVAMISKRDIINHYYDLGGI